MSRLLTSYLESVFWTETDNNEIPLDRNYSHKDVDADTRIRMQTDIDSFFEKACEIAPEESSEFLMHNFWLTRNRSGAGFWDGRCASEEIGRKLTELSHTYREVCTYVGDDGKIYQDGN
jgi:hypothetical protein